MTASTDPTERVPRAPISTCSGVTVRDLDTGEVLRVERAYAPAELWEIEGRAKWRKGAYMRDLNRRERQGRA